ncbi:MAG: hypothetical protein KF819_25110 [Labilithrix sp.]|nr:hypothetical protein [Labilithrix sp.]
MAYRIPGLILADRRRTLRKALVDLERARADARAELAAIEEQLRWAARVDAKLPHPPKRRSLAIALVAVAAGAWIVGLLFAFGVSRDIDVTRLACARLELDTDRPALVLDNGHKLGETPIDVNVAAGSHRLQLVGAGGERVTLYERLPPGSHRVVKIDLP